MKQSVDHRAAEDLARWVGRREAFAMTAGRCSAAEAESLRRMREDKQYRKLGMTWEKFCAQRLGVSRRHIDRTIRLLDEFGPAYFHVAQMAHVSPDEYRAIAPHVSADGVRVDGAVVALLPENTEQVSAAVAELLRREKPATPAKAPSAFDAVIKRCESVAESLSGLGELTLQQKLEVTRVVCRIRNAASTKGVISL
jgi:hypothetical protein